MHQGQNLCHQGLCPGGPWCSATVVPQYNPSMKDSSNISQYGKYIPISVVIQIKVLAIHIDIKYNNKKQTNRL